MTDIPMKLGRHKQFFFIKESKFKLEIQFIFYASKCCFRLPLSIVNLFRVFLKTLKYCIKENTFENKREVTTK